MVGHISKGSLYLSSCRTSMSYLKYVLDNKVGFKPVDLLFIVKILTHPSFPGREKPQSRLLPLA